MDNRTRLAKINAAKQKLKQFQGKTTSPATRVSPENWTASKGQSKDVGKNYFPSIDDSLSELASLPTVTETEKRKSRSTPPNQRTTRPSAEPAVRNGHPPTAHVWPASSMDTNNNETQPEMVQPEMVQPEMVQPDGEAPSSAQQTAPGQRLPSSTLSPIAQLNGLAPSTSGRSPPVKRQKPDGHFSEQPSRPLLVTSTPSSSKQHGSPTGAVSSEPDQLGPLRDQLQVHIQTIGILVSEKTELQALVAQCQAAVERSKRELDETAGRLKASRSRVADLEKQLAAARALDNESATAERDHRRSMQRLGGDLERLRSDHQRLAGHNEQLEDLNKELREKLQRKSQDTMRLEQNVRELQSKFEFAQVQLQQVRNANDGHDDSAVRAQAQSIDAENRRLSAELEQVVIERDQLKTALQRVREEKDGAVAQFQQYVDGLQRENKRKSDQLDRLTAEHDRISAVLAEQQASAPANGQADGADQAEADGNKEDQLTSARAECDRLSQENSRLNGLVGELETVNERCSVAEAERAKLEETLFKAGLEMEQLRETNETLRHQEDARDQLLEQIQADKAALSRAAQHNAELKSQLAELQAAYVRMTNDNMELLMKSDASANALKRYQTEAAQPSSDDSSVQLGAEMDDLRAQLADSARMVSDLQDALAKKTQSPPGTSSDKSTQVAVPDGDSRDNDSHNKENNQPEPVDNEKGQSEDEVNSKEAELQHCRLTIETLNASVRQLEAERDQLYSQFAQVADRCNRVDAAEQSEQQKDEQLRTLHDSFSALQTAMGQLEAKHVRTLDEKAEMSERIDQLEHVCAVLQTEADTIGDYISLYHAQRSMLLQRQKDKDQYLTTLMSHYTTQQQRISQLQSLLGQYSALRASRHQQTRSGPAEIDYDEHAGSQWPDLVDEPSALLNGNRAAAAAADDDDDDDDERSSTYSSDFSDVEPIRVTRRILNAKEHSHYSASPNGAGQGDAASNEARERETLRKIVNVLRELNQHDDETSSVASTNTLAELDVDFRELTPDVSRPNDGRAGLASSTLSAPTPVSSTGRITTPTRFVHGQAPARRRHHPSSSSAAGELMIPCKCCQDRGSQLLVV